MSHSSDLVFVAAGIGNKKRKQKQIYPSGIKKGRSWLFVLLKRQSVALVNRAPSLSAQGSVTACSAGQSEGTGTHLGCGIDSESRLRIVPGPSRILHEDTCHISSVIKGRERNNAQFTILSNN